MIVPQEQDRARAMREAGASPQPAYLKMLAENVRPGVTTGDLDGLAESLSTTTGASPSSRATRVSGLYLRLPQRHDRARHPRLLSPEGQRHNLPGRRGAPRGLRNRLCDHGPRRGGAEEIMHGSSRPRGRCRCGHGADALGQKARRRGPRDTGSGRVARLRGGGLISHGVGRRMHEDPQIPNYGRPVQGSACSLG